MITMTSSKVTPNPMMTLLSIFGKSDSWLSWEPWRRSMRESVRSTFPLPTPPSPVPFNTHQYHQPQLQQLCQGVLVIPDHPGHRGSLASPRLPAPPPAHIKGSPTHTLSSSSVRADPFEKTK